MTLTSIWFLMAMASDCLWVPKGDSDGAVRMRRARSRKENFWSGRSYREHYFKVLLYIRWYPIICYFLKLLLLLDSTGILSSSMSMNYQRNSVSNRKKTCSAMEYCGSHAPYLGEWSSFCCDSLGPVSGGTNGIPPMHAIVGSAAVMRLSIENFCYIISDAYIALGYIGNYDYIALECIIDFKFLYERWRWICSSLLIKS